MEMGILGLLLLAAAFVTYWVSRNRGYPGFLFAILALLFPVMVIIVFFLPDKSKAKKREEIDRAFERSLEKQQKASVQSKPAVLKPEPKPAVSSAVKQKIDLPTQVKKPVTADTVVLHEHAMKCYREGQYFLAIGYFEKVAETGHIDSQMYTAQMYYQGQGREVDYEKALYWYEQAAMQGQKTAQSNTANMYKNGTGCSADPAKALYWYEKAAEQGDDNAQLWAGMMYELGQGCTKDTKKARYWYEKAAAQGNADAKKLLSNMND